MYVFACFEKEASRTAKFVRAALRDSLFVHHQVRETEDAAHFSRIFLLFVNCFFRVLPRS